MKEIREAVARVARRLFLARLYERLGKSLFYAALVLVALYALDKVVHTGLPAWVFPAAVVPLSLIGGFVWAWRVRPTELEAAVGIDGSLGLKERISSALALGEPSRPIEEALIADAASKVKGLEPQRVVRFVTPRELKWLWAPAVLALLLVTLVPSFDLFGRKLAAEERKQTEQENRKEARRIKAQLDKLKRKLGKDPVKRNKSLLQDMERIASDLEKADSPDARKRSMREMQALGDKLKDSQASAQAAAAVDLGCDGVVPAATYLSIRARGLATHRAAHDPPPPALGTRTLLAPSTSSSRLH